MSVVKPLKIIGGGITTGSAAAPELQELHRNEYTAMIDETIRQFGLQPGSTLYATTGTVSTAAGGSVGTLTDTRKKAGAAGSDSTNFDTESETQDVQTETTNFVRVYSDSHNDLISDASAHFPVTAAIQAAKPEKLKGSGYSGASGYSYPLYRVGSGASVTLQPMTRSLMLDTFWLPAVKRMMIADTSNADTAGTFITTTTTTLSNHTSANTTGSALAAPSSSLAIFSNTKADVSAFASGDLPETLDQTTGTTNYYLQRRNASSTQGQMAAVVGIFTATGELRAIPHSVLGLQLREIARYGSTFGNTAHAVGSKKGRIRYRFISNSSGLGQSIIANATANDSDGNPLGVIRSTILDTAYNSSTYRTQLVSDDYRSQEVPAGSEATVTDMKFVINRE
jgi:hypothetical protein